MDGTPTIRNQCQATRRDGSPCRAPALPGEAQCFAHAAATRGKREAARARGGRNRAAAARAEKLLPSHMRPVLNIVLVALRDVRAGTLTAAQGGAIAALASAAVKVYAAGLLEQRVEELEATWPPQEGQGRA